MKPLHLKPITRKELEIKWNMNLSGSNIPAKLYIRCTVTGKVNWAKASIYYPPELEKIKQHRKVRLIL